MERGKGTKSIVSQNEPVIGEILAEQTRTEKIHLFLTVSRRKAFKLLVHWELVNRKTLWVFLSTCKLYSAKCPMNIFESAKEDGPCECLVALTFAFSN